jgi:energy-converting hydrogenase Eha subunit G
MEFLLLWADELDDALGALRHLWPQIVDFVLAMLLFVITGFGLLLATQITLPGVVVMLAAMLLELLRLRRARRRVAGEPNM